MTSFNQQENDVVIQKIIGGGEMGDLIRNFHWSKTPLGPVSDWQQHLLFAVNMMLQSPAPLLLLWGVEGIALYNDAYKEFAGGKHPALLGARGVLGWYEVAESIRDILHKCLNGKSLSYNKVPYTLYRNNTPEEIWVDYFCSPVFDSNGRSGGALVVVLETTKYVYTEKALKEGEERFRLVVEGTDDGVWDFNLKTRRAFWNDRMYEIIGYSQEEVALPGFDFLQEITHPEDKLRVQEAFTKAEYEGENYDVEYRVQHKKGHFVHLHAKGKAVFDEQGNITRIAGITTDITDRKKGEEALKESEERFSAIFNQSSVGIAETDLMGKFVLVNDKYCQMVGRSKEELYQMRMQDISHEKDLPENLIKFKQAINEGIPFKIEKRYLRNDGSEIWVTNNVSLIKDVNGKPMYIVAVCQDITERKQAEMALLESEERFRNMADAAPLIIWMGNTKGENIYMNPAWQQLTGRNPEKDTGYGWEEVIHPDDLQSTWENYKTALEKAEPFTVEFRVRRYDGQYRLLYCQGSPRQGSGGEFLGYVGICQDITERKQAEKALEESEELFRTFANHIQNLAWMAKSDGWTYWFNKRWYDYTGISPEEAEGYGWQKGIHPDFVKNVMDYVVGAMAKEDKWEFTFPMKGADGNYRWFLTRAYAVKDAEGKVLRWIGTNTDIEEQKKAEEELKEKNEELQKINNDLDNFIYTASHDLKAPIANLEGLMNMLVQELPAEVLHNEIIDKIIQLVKDSVSRFRSTINDLTDLSKLQRNVDNEESKVQLQDVFEEVRLDLATPIQQTGAQLEVDFSQCPTLHFSKRNLRSIIYNLISNAVKYHSPERCPYIRVFSEKEQHYNILTVEDNGLGMDLTQSDKVFSMFKRLHDHVEGSGIGLYIVKKIIENSGGRIEVESEVGKGSTFKVFFKRKSVAELV